MTKSNQRPRWREIEGEPEGNALGYPGDLLYARDTGLLWIKTRGLGNSIGWEVALTDSDADVTIEQDGAPVGSTATLNFTGSVVVTPDIGNDRIDIEVGGDLQPSLSENNVLRLVPANVGVAPVNVGIPNTSSGGVTHPALVNTNLVTSTPRTRWTSAIAAANSAGHRSNVLLWWRGNAAGLGGFDITFRFAVTAFVINHRAFVGLRGATAQIPNAVDPSTLTDIVGIGYDLGSSQWALMHNDGAGAATVTPLGAAFNVNTGQLLELRLQCNPNSTSISWTVTNLSTGVVTSGTISTEIPANTVFLSSNCWANTGSDATTGAQIDVAFIYAQS